MGISAAICPGRPGGKPKCLGLATRAEQEDGGCSQSGKKPSSGRVHRTAGVGAGGGSRDGATVTFRAAFLGHDICELLSVVKCTPRSPPCLVGVSAVRGISSDVLGTSILRDVPGS